MRIFSRSNYVVKFRFIFHFSAFDLSIRFNPFMHNVEKWLNILQKSCGVHTAIFLKYVWPFFNTMHETVTTQYFFSVTPENLKKPEAF